MRTTIDIGVATISTDKIHAVSYQEGKVIIHVQGGDVIEYPDMDGAKYSRAMKEWREYLEDKQAQFQEAVQYGIILGMERGAMNV